MKNKEWVDVPRHFNACARLLHWLMAFMILAMLFIGVGMTTSLHHRLWLFDLHQTLGIAILVLVMLRAINRLLYLAPSLPAKLPKWQKLVAGASHLVFYALMFALPIIGWATLSAGGYPIVLLDGFNLATILEPSPLIYALLRDAHGLLA